MSRWSAVFAVLLGTGAAVAFGDDAPLAPKNLIIVSLGEGSAVSRDGGQWTDLRNGVEWSGLTLTHPTFVRGPARIRVVAGTYVEVPAGHVLQASWEPAIRGWTFLAVSGDSNAQFANTSTWIPQGRAITMSSGGEIYHGPNHVPMGYGPPSIVVPGLTGLPEVSGFRIAVVDVR